MKNFRWILLSGLLVASTQIAQAQVSSDPRMAPSNIPAPSSIDGSSTGAASSTADAGAITNTTTTTTTTGVAPDGSNGSFVPADDAAFGDSSASMDSSMPNTGGEPMIAVVAGLSIAGAALAMRRKVIA